MSILLFSACSQNKYGRIDKLNEQAYAYHYRSLDSVLTIARQAKTQARHYSAGEAEALNNLAFVSIAKMDYTKAKLQLDSISTNNLIEMLIANVQYMRLCQRESKNKLFYEYRERAMRLLRRIDEEKEQLNDHWYKRYIYAKSEYAIVESTYFYYVGLNALSRNAIESINLNGEIEKDTAQLLNYLYNMGAGGVITAGSKTEVAQKELEYLIRCYQIAQRSKYPYFTAQALQGMSEHLEDFSFREQFLENNAPVATLINPDEMPDSLLAGYLAQRALEIFQSYGDVYQIAGAYRTLAECFWEIKDYPSAEVCLLRALYNDKSISQAPDLVASIREQLSLVYSAIDDKERSDFNRNIYLDMQEQTRQDRQLEARADQLRSTSRQLNSMIIAVVLMIMFVLSMLFIFHNMRKRSDRRLTIEELLKPLEEWKQKEQDKSRLLEEQFENIEEEKELMRLHILANKKRNVEQRAKVALANSIMPFIDRIINEAKRLLNDDENDYIRRNRCTYIAELTEKINQYNDVLTQWIQMRKGDISMHIESFPLQTLFDIVKRNDMSFQLKGIDLNVKDTTDFVKADKILTLFMINTMADNARKFTPEGGSVTISSSSTEEYVEISVADTGIGMTAEQIDLAINHKARNARQNVETTSQKEYGFGLMNCKGIIEKYKKTSKIFNVCDINAESTPGNGSRFFFRLPKGIIRSLIVGIIFWSAAPLRIYAISDADSHPLVISAAAFADSAYYSNIDHSYEQTLSYADSCMRYLNDYHEQMRPGSSDFMIMADTTSARPAELTWYEDSIPASYDIILDIRNETAVAALALHKWDIYNYNNKVYTQLFRELSADKTLERYCQIMQKSEANKNIAIIILIFLLLSIFPAYYLLYYRHRIAFRINVELLNSINQILLSEATAKQKLKNINNLLERKPVRPNQGFQNLDKLVIQISDALKERIDIDGRQNETIELAQDKLNKLKYENEKLHISNNILDNSLSTLKHETMYYPSRIRQLLPNYAEEDGVSNVLNRENIIAISKLASYYKELYATFCMLALRQIEAASRIDSDMIDFLFDLFKRNGGQPPKVADESTHNDYVDIDIEMPVLKLNSSQRKLLFSPLTINTDFFICRQIIRELGEAESARGCGVVVKEKDGEDCDPATMGEVIRITLTKHIWSHLKLSS